MEKWLLILLIIPFTYATPFSENGELHVCGNQMCNENNYPIMLRGVSTHGINWFGWADDDCMNEASMDALADDWGADILRIANYPEGEGDGYVHRQAHITNVVDTMIEAATERGMYVLVDWHQGLDGGGGDPNYWFDYNGQDYVTPFFEHVATKYGEQGNIIYGICNEPNDAYEPLTGLVTWSTIKTYADRLIPSIRAIDPDGLVLVGTPHFASFGIHGGMDFNDVLNDQLQFDNVIYDFHLYAFGDAKNGEYYNGIDTVSDQLPTWCAESASTTGSGTGSMSFENHDGWHEMFNEKKISWMHWTYTDYEATGSLWTPGTCYDGEWTSDRYTEQGDYIWDKMNNPPDDWGTLAQCTGYCCPVGSTCSNPMAGSCTIGTCCASQTECIIDSSCGDGNCEGTEDCGTCEADCGACCVPMTTAELIIEINRWKQGVTAIQELMEAIATWKSGC